MRWKLSKVKKDILEISEIKVEFEDSYSSVHLRPYYIKKAGLKPPCKISKADNPTLYKEFSDLITSINLFKPREEVPNKRVTTDVPGLSKLIRSKDKDTITLCFRVKKKSGETEKMATSSNTCYISEKDAFYCMKHFDIKGGFKGGNVYYITVDHPEFEYWFNFMDEEYARLAGVKYQKKVKPTRPSWGIEEMNWARACLDAYAAVGRNTPDLDIYKALAEAGYCKIDNKETCIYNIHGYYICGLEEFLGQDVNAFILKWILAWLNKSQLKSVEGIIKRFVLDDSQGQ